MPWDAGLDAGAASGQLLQPPAAVQEQWVQCNACQKWRNISPYVCGRREACWGCNGGGKGWRLSASLTHALCPTLAPAQRGASRHRGAQSGRAVVLQIQLRKVPIQIPWLGGAPSLAGPGAARPPALLQSPGNRPCLRRRQRCPRTAATLLLQLTPVPRNDSQARCKLQRPRGLGGARGVTPARPAAGCVDVGMGCGCQGLHAPVCSDRPCPPLRVGPWRTTGSTAPPPPCDGEPPGAAAGTY